MESDDGRGNKTRVTKAISHGFQDLIKATEEGRRRAAVGNQTPQTVQDDDSTRVRRCSSQSSAGRVLRTLESVKCPRRQGIMATRHLGRPGRRPQHFQGMYMRTSYCGSMHVLTSLVLLLQACTDIAGAAPAPVNYQQEIPLAAADDSSNIAAVKPSAEKARTPEEWKKISVQQAFWELGHQRSQPDHSNRQVSAVVGNGEDPPVSDNLLIRIPTSLALSAAKHKRTGRGKTSNSIRHSNTIDGGGGILSKYEFDKVSDERFGSSEVRRAYHPWIRIRPSSVRRRRLGHRFGGVTNQHHRSKRQLQIKSWWLPLDGGGTIMAAPRGSTDGVTPVRVRCRRSPPTGGANLGSGPASAGVVLCSNPSLSPLRDILQASRLSSKELLDKRIREGQRILDGLG